MKPATIAMAVLSAFLSFTVAASGRLATQAQIELVREGMQSRLKDADSAKFRNVRFGTGAEKDTVCGEVNAKNSFGAYGGYVTFLGSYIGPEDYTDSATVKHKPKIYIIGIDENPGGASSMICAEKGI